MSCFTAMSAVTAASEFDLTKHVNYTAGMILGVDDFTQEFAYLAGRDRWMAREALGYGTVSGLRVRVEEQTDDYQVVIEPGVAISPRGQLICVSTAQCAFLNQWLAAAKPEDLNEWIQTADTSPPVITSPGSGSELMLYVVLCYRDCLTDNAPIPGEPCRNENELMAASRVKDDFSLELRFEPPKQLEEDAVRRFSDFLKGIEISDDVTSTPVDEFLDAIRAEFLSTGSPSSASPPVSPPAPLQIHPEDVAEYMRLAFRLWTTELRIVLSERETGCAKEMSAAGTLDDCILLAELRVPLESFGSGWRVSDEADVELNEDARPFLLHLRMLQEWMLNEPNDHGHLTGLEDDDHPQYLLIDGTRAMTGNLRMGNKRITNLAPGIDPRDAVNYDQAVKVDDPAGGDLGGTYPNPTIAKLQGKTLTIDRNVADGQILMFRGNKWVNVKPITDHDELAGLGDDDHKQYLLLTGSRAMTGDLKLGGKKIVDLAPGTDPTDAVNVSQVIKINDAAGGDLTGTYPHPTISHLQGKPVNAAPTADGQVLTFRGATWVAENPASGGVTDHGALTGLADDDHPQYLPLTGARPMTGNLLLGSKQIKNLAAGTASTDAVNFGQVIRRNEAVTGDLAGSFPGWTIGKLQGKTVNAPNPATGDALIWNGNEWAPARAQTAETLLNIMPLVTITRRDNDFYEVWFHVDAPANLIAVEKMPTTAEQTHIVVEGEDEAVPDFLERIPAVISPGGFRNVFHVSLQRPEMQYMRFTFSLSLIRVKPEGPGIATSLAAYARANAIRFQNSFKEETATYFVRLDQRPA